jgi:hypothetical protein
LSVADEKEACVAPYEAGEAATFSASRVADAAGDADSASPTLKDVADAEGASAHTAPPSPNLSPSFCPH